MSDVGVRHAVVPCEFVLIPKSPEEAEKNRAGGEQIAEAAPEELAGFGKGAINGNGGEAANLHARSRAGEQREEDEVKGVNQEKYGRVDAKLRAKKAELAAERTEKAEETDENGGDNDGVQNAGKAARGQFCDGKRRFCRTEAVVFDDGEIQFRLGDVNLDALRWAKAGNGARRNGGGDDVWNAAAEGQSGLGLLGIVSGEHVVAAGTINFEAAGDLTAPFRFFGCGGWARRRGLGRRGGRLTKRAHVNVLITNRATLRANLDHRLVLRCGPDWRTTKS